MLQVFANHVFYWTKWAKWAAGLVYELLGLTRPYLLV